MELGVGVEEQGADVDGDQADAGQGGGAVHLVEAEPAQTRRPGVPSGSTMPRTMLSVNTTSATTPVPRPRAHSASFMPLPPCGQPPSVTTLPSCDTRRAGSPVSRSQARASRALDHGGGGGGVGAQGSRRDDGDAAPGAAAAEAGGGVDEVVPRLGRGRPGAPGGAGGRDRGAGGQRDLLGYVVWQVLHEHLPAALGSRAGGGDVAAEADQHTGLEAARDEPGAPVGGTGLRGRAEVELQCRAAAAAGCPRG